MSRRRALVVPPAPGSSIRWPPSDERWIQCFPVLVLAPDVDAATALQCSLTAAGYRQVHASSFRGRLLQIAQRIQPAIIVADLGQGIGHRLPLIAEIKHRLERTPHVIGLCAERVAQGVEARLAEVLDERLDHLPAFETLRARLDLALAAWASASDRVDRRQELLVLEAVSRLAGASAPLDRLLNGVVREMTRLPWTDFAAIALPNSGRLYWTGRWQSERGAGPQLRRPVTLTEIEALIDRKSPASAQALSGADIESLPALTGNARAAARRLGLQTLVRLPLYVGEQLAGVLAVGRRSLVPLTPRQLARLTHLAAQVGSLLDRAGLIEDLATRSRRFEAFQRIVQAISSSLEVEAVLDAAVEVGALLEADALRIWLRDGEAPVLRLARVSGPPPAVTTIPIDGSLAGQVLAAGRPFATGDLRRYQRQAALYRSEPDKRCAWLGAPFASSDSAAGVIAALTWREGGFTSEDAQLLATVATCLGAALQNAALYQQARQTAEELRILHARAEEAQQRLQRQLDFTTAITSHLEDGILVVDPSGAIVFANPAVGRLLGASAPLLIGQPLCRVATFLLDAQAEGQRQTCPLEEVLRTGATVRTGSAWLRGPSDQARPVAYTASPMFDQGQVSQVVLAVHDLSERRRAEEADAQLLRSASLTAMGMQASSVVHELSQPLAAVRAMLETLIEEEWLSPHGSVLAERMQRALGRMGQTISHLRRFARRATGAPAEVDLRTVVSNALALVEHEYRLADIQVLQTYDPSLPLIYANADELEHVVVNLLTNARDAMDGRGGRVRISGERVNGPGGRLWVALRIFDDGPGMSDEVRRQLFQPLFTTKSPERGLGLGLAISQRIVQRHGGSIEVDSHEGQGTCFSVLLPVTSPPLDPAAEH